MKKASFFLAIIALTVSGCTAEVLSYNGNPHIFTASFENSSTKVYVDDELNTRWNADDCISIFMTTENVQYRFNGQDGEKSGCFSEVGSVSGNGEEIPSVLAVYPYNSQTCISESGDIALVLPGVQAYANNSYGPGANTMVAATENSYSTSLQFKSVCGFLVIKLFGKGSVKSVSIKGNNGEKLAGAASVTASYGNCPTVLMADDADETITIDCGEGVTLGASSSSATKFWFCIPPVTFSKGFTVTVEDATGNMVEKRSTVSRTITRNVVNSLSALEVSFKIQEPEMIDLGLSVNWASFNVGATKPEEYGDYYAWGATECWYDGGYARENPQSHWKAGKSAGYIWGNAPYQTVDTGNWAETRWTKYLGSNFSSYKDATASETDALKTTLDLEDDIAFRTFGVNWRMPTIEEFKELLEKCTWTWTSTGGVKGYKVSGKGRDYSDKFIFLPAAGYREYSNIYNVGSDGYYWTSSLDTSEPYNAAQIYFFTGTKAADVYVRSCGQSVRPVCEKQQTDSITP